MFSKYLSEQICEKLKSFTQIQEIRIRAGCCVQVIHTNGTVWLDEVVTYNDVQKIFGAVCSNSVYALKEEIKRGFVTLPGGHRVGICGRCICSGQRIDSVTDITSLNFRVAREFINCSSVVFKKLSGKPHSVVFISPPNSGKTTYLRDLCRLFSLNGYVVSIIDERGEIAPHSKGVSVFSFGKGVDVMQFAPKIEGLMLALRSMNPHIIATDEIGNDEEGQAIAEISKCGVSVFATFHGAKVDDFRERFKSWNVFEYAVLLNKDKKVEAIECLNGLEQHV